MGMDVRIVRLTDGWLDRKAQLHAQTWHETYAGLLAAPAVAMVTPEFARRCTIRHDYATCLLVTVGDRAVGYAEFLVPARPPVTDPTCAEVASLYVLRSHQGLGIGRRLLRAAMEATGRPDRIVLWMFAGNDRALGFYRHMGFHPTGRRQHEDIGDSIELANFTAQSADY